MRLSWQNIPSPLRFNPPSALGLILHAVDALEQRNATTVVDNQLPPSSARPDRRENFRNEFHGEDGPPRSITPDPEPDIAAVAAPGQRNTTPAVVNQVPPSARPDQREYFRSESRKWYDPSTSPPVPSANVLALASAWPQLAFAIGNSHPLPQGRNRGVRIRCRRPRFFLILVSHFTATSHNRRPHLAGRRGTRTGASPAPWCFSSLGGIHACWISPFLLPEGFHRRATIADLRRQQW